MDTATWGFVATMGAPPAKRMSAGVGLAKCGNRMGCARCGQHRCDATHAGRKFGMCGYVPALCADGRDGRVQLFGSQITHTHTHIAQS
eukprot:360519-Chlamydomonas_euryale.AAC.5